MAGMIQQWLREDAELFSKRKEAAKQAAEDSKEEDEVEASERVDSLEGV